LSSEPYVFDKHVYLEGTARVGGREGKFSKNLDADWSPDPLTELIREVRFPAGGRTP
jgi:hypothetical protein